MEETNKYINDIDISRFNGFLQGRSNAEVFYRIDDLPTVEELFPDHVYYAVLFKSNPGTEIGHWVCLIKHSELEFEYFDCLGDNPPEEVHSMLREYSERNNLYEITLEGSNTKLMSRDNYICGKWVMFRIQCLPNDLNSFITFIKLLTKGKKGLKPDDIVNFIVNIPYAYEE